MKTHSKIRGPKIYFLKNNKSHNDGTYRLKVIRERLTVKAEIYFKEFKLRIKSKYSTYPGILPLATSSSLQWAKNNLPEKNESIKEE